MPFTNAFSKGDFELEFFAPRGKDYQTPHEKDEFYIIASGSAILFKDGERISCSVGDALFVEASVEYHFENISEGVASRVFFYFASSVFFFQKTYLFLVSGNFFCSAPIIYSGNY